VCGAVIEETSREGGGHGFKPRRPHSVATLREKYEDGWLSVGVPPSHKKIIYLFILGFLRHPRFLFLID
jgi:hypothetical protein